MTKHDKKVPPGQDKLIARERIACLKKRSASACSGRKYASASSSSAAAANARPT